jgi:hypothetical protein
MYLLCSHVKRSVQTLLYTQVAGGGVGGIRGEGGSVSYLPKILQSTGNSKTKKSVKESISNMHVEHASFFT